MSENNNTSVKTEPSQTPAEASKSLHQNLIEIVTAAAEKGAGFTQSLVVRLSRVLENMKKISMYGQRLYDTVTPKEEQEKLYDKIDGKETHNWYDVTPFGKSGASTNCILTYENPQGERYVLMGRKKTTEFFHFPGGYIDPHPPGENTLNNPRYDDNIRAIGIREVKEETGIDWPKDKPIAIIGEPVSQYGVAEGVKCQHIWYCLLFDFGQLETAPPITATDDLLTPRWVNIKDMQFEKRYQLHGVEHADVRVKSGGEERLVKPLHAPYLERAIEMVKDKERPVPLETIKNLAVLSPNNDIKAVVASPSVFESSWQEYHKRTLEAGNKVAEWARSL